MNLLVIVFINFILILLFILTVKNYGGSQILYNLQNSNSKDNNINNIGEHFANQGKWMPGKRHSQMCGFVDKKKCCKNKQNLHFEFHEDRLNQIDAVEELRKILKNKKLLLIGDSLMFEFFVGLQELLRVKSRVKMTRYFCENTSCSIHPGNNSTMTFLSSCMIVLEGKEPFPNVDESRQISERIVRKEIANYDIRNRPRNPL